MPRVFVIQKARASKKERKCKVCGHEIRPGETYKYADKRVSYPGFASMRPIWCAEHGPDRYEFIQNPKVLALAQLQDNLDEALTREFDEGDVEAAIEDAASALDDLAEEQREHAENIQEGFGHATSMSEEFEEKAGATEEAAEALRNYDYSSERPDEPNDPFEPVEPEEPERKDYETDKEFQRAQDEFKIEMEDYESDLDEYEDALMTVDNYESELENWRESVRDELGEIVSNVEA